MPQPETYKTALKAYRKGFLIGAFAGVVGCLFIGKPIYSLPLVLGLLFGAIAFDRNFNQNETTSK